MPSTEYIHLKNRIEALKARFLSFSIPPEAVSPSAEELDSIACFKLLSHSEVEWYLESRAKLALSARIDAWKSRREWSECIAVMLGGWGHHPELDFRNYTSSTADGIIDLIIDARVKVAQEEISKNNSVKREAFLKLMAIGGLCVDSHDETLLASLENFGLTRGDVAHQPVGRVRSLDAPEIEAERADQLVDLLLAFDDAIG